VKTKGVLKKRKWASNTFVLVALQKKENGIDSDCERVTDIVKTRKLYSCKAIKNTIAFAYLFQ